MANSFYRTSVTRMGAEFFKESTRQFFVKYPDLKPKEREPGDNSDLQHKLYSAVDRLGLDSSSKRAASELVALMTGIEPAECKAVGGIPETVPMDDLENLILVPITNRNTHDYRLGECVLPVRFGETAVRALMIVGDTLGNNLRPTDCRVASEAEIDAVFAEITK